MVGEVVGVAVMGDAVGDDDGTFVGFLVVVGAIVDGAAGPGAVGAAGTKLVGGFVVLGLGPVISDGAVGGLAVSCARAVLVPPAAERTVAATTHTRPLRCIFVLFR